MLHGVSKPVCRAVVTAIPNDPRLLSDKKLERELVTCGGATIGGEYEATAICPACDCRDVCGYYKEYVRRNNAKLRQSV